MEVSVLNRNLNETNGLMLVLPIQENLEFYHELNEVNNKLGNTIKDLIKDKEFEGKLNQTYLINSLGKLNFKKVLLIGLGKDVSIEKIMQAYGTASKYANSLKLKEYSTVLVKAKKIDAEKIIENTVLGARLGAYEYTKFKTKNKNEINKIELFSIITKEQGKKIEDAVKKAIILTDSVFLVRNLVNDPASLKTPLMIAEIVRKVAKNSGLRYKVYRKKDLEKMKMGAILGVARGSEQEPAMVVLEYNGRRKAKKIALVGKGITFDSGGINLKPWEGMTNMKMDMAGAATVLGIMRTASLLKLNINLIGLMPLTENMPGGNATKTGDILTGYSGKTIEVSHTDAEGRLILSDALSYAEKNYKPDKMIDFATLTGACLVALGSKIAGLMANNKDLTKELQNSSENTGEKIWELPLYDEFKKDVESKVADVKNLGHPKGYAGTITAASFLSTFVEKTAWAHLDIAGTAWSDETSNYLSEGGTGFGIRLIIDFLINQK
ncbi:leucyl aminopeptidase [Candidatus Woesearchaeota archaeon]|nr:leucyl aminopeptidase [Candidatus Woesearchaeota archaeon]